MMIPTTLDRKTWKKWLLCPILAALLVLSCLPVYAGGQQTEQTESTETPTVTQDTGSESAKESAASSEQKNQAPNESVAAEQIGLGQSENTVAATSLTETPPYEGQVLDGGYVGFKNKATGKYLTIPNGATSAGTNVCQQSASSVPNAQEFYLDYTHLPNKNVSYFTIYPVDASTGNATSTRVKSAAISSGTANVSLQYFMPTEMTDRWQIKHAYDNYYYIYIANRPDATGTQYALTAYGNQDGSADGNTITSPGNVYVSSFSTINNYQLWEICADGKPMDINSNDIIEDQSYDLSEEEFCTFYYIPKRYNESLTWLSTNSLTVTVDPTLGKATAMAPGIATIKILINKDGLETIESVDVYVILPNGVYYLNSVVNGMRMDLNEDKVSENNPVQIHNSGNNTQDTNALNYLYKFHYLGNGLYSIRSMLKNAMGITHTYSSNIVRIKNIGTSHDAVPDMGQWYLDKDSNGYILFAKSGRSKTITVPIGAESSDDLVFSEYSSNTTNQAWEIRSSSTQIHQIGLSGVFEDLVSQNEYEIMPHYLSHLDVYNGNVELDWEIVTGNDVVEFGDSFGTIKIIGAGEFIIRVYTKQHSQYIEQDFALYAYSTPSQGDWFIKNVLTEKVLSTSGLVDPETIVMQSLFADHIYMEWELIHDSGNYFYIKSKSSGLYLMASSNVLNPVIQDNITSDNENRALWKIERTSNNRYKITCKAYETGNWVLLGSTNANNSLCLSIYSDDINYYDEWYLNISGAELTILAIAEPDRSRGEEALITDDNANIYNVDCNTIVTDKICKESIITGMETSKVFVSRSHGLPTCILINDDSAGADSMYLEVTDIYNFETNIALIDLSDCDLVAFIACQTGAHSDNQGIIHAAVAAGADAAIGFGQSISTDKADTWMMHFLNFYMQGYSINNSIVEALALESGGRMDSVILYTGSNQ